MAKRKELTDDELCRMVSERTMRKMYSSIGTESDFDISDEDFDKVWKSVKMIASDVCAYTRKQTLEEMLIWISKEQSTWDIESDEYGELEDIKIELEQKIKEMK